MTTEKTGSKLNIVHFSSEYLASDFSHGFKGGLGVVAGDILRGLAEKGHSVRLLLPRIFDSYWRDRIEDDKRVKIEYVRAEGSQFSCGEIGGSIIDFPESYSHADITKFLKNINAFGNSALEKLVSLSNSSQLDVVHFHDWHFGRLAEKVSKARAEGKLNPNLRIVSTIHNALYQGRVPLTDESCATLGFDDKTPLSEFRQNLHEGHYSFLKTILSTYYELDLKSMFSS